MVTGVEAALRPEQMWVPGLLVCTFVAAGP